MGYRQMSVCMYPPYGILCCCSCRDDPFAFLFPRIVYFAFCASIRLLFRLSAEQYKAHYKYTFARFIRGTERIKSSVVNIEFIAIS